MIFSLLALLQVGCAPETDVSGLQCAGLEDLDGNVLVPKVSKEGCTGAEVDGHFDCDGCTIDEGQVVQLFVRPVDGGVTSNIECAEANLSEEGHFSLGVLAPSQDYGVAFSGHVNDGRRGYSEIETFEVCSTDVVVTGVIVQDEGTGM